MKSIFSLLKFLTYNIFLISYTIFLPQSYAGFLDPCGAGPSDMIEICIESGNNGPTTLPENSANIWKSFGDYDKLILNDGWKTAAFSDLKTYTNTMEWKDPNTFSEYLYDSDNKTKTVNDLFITPDLTVESNAKFMWHDDTGLPEQKNGTSGAIDAYFRYDLDISQIFGDVDRTELKLLVAMSADDDFELFVNGMSILKDNDFGLTGDLGPDYVFTSTYLHADHINEFGTGKSLFDENIVKIAIHATDGNLINPESYFQKRLLADIRIRGPVPLSAPSTIMLMIFGLFIIAKCKLHLFKPTSTNTH